jgi:hypothetical protein
MGIVLFDWETSSTTKKVVKPLFKRLSLFDGYLTEPSSYPHSSLTAYLTGSCLSQTQTSLNDLFSSISLFDSYLTTHQK